MSVSAFPAAPEGPEPSTAAPRLHLVPEQDHEHVWQLRAVEYDEALEVRRYECTHCDDVLFR